MARDRKKAVPFDTIAKLAAASAKAGVGLDDVFLLLRAGLAVEELLEIIESELVKPERSQRRIM